MFKPIPFIDLKRFEDGFVEAYIQKCSLLISEANYIGGSEVSLLEKNLTDYLGVSNVVSCGSGTDALQLALRALGVGRGDFVLVPNVTFWATFEAVINVGANPFTIDASLIDGGVSFEAFEQAVIELKPRAAIIAHLYGWGSERLAELRQLCRAHGVFLIEDGAQVFGTKYEGGSIFKGAYISTTSFYPAKVLGAAGDGGAVFTNDAYLAEKVRMLSNHGRLSHYAYGDVGWNSRLDTLQAAFLNLSLENIDERISSRRNAVGFYRKHLSGLGIQIMSAPKAYEENGYCFSLLILDKHLKLTVESKLKIEGIGFGNIYPSVISSQPGAVSYLKGHFGGQVGDQLCASVLNLPLFPYMMEQELQRVVDVVRESLMG